MKITLMLFNLVPHMSNFVPKYALKNPKQIKLQSYIRNPNINIVISTGAAGTGKTMIACQEGIKLFKQGEYSKILITRPTVTVEENLGYLPGTLEDKIYPFLIPIYDYFLEHYTKDNLMTMIRNGKLEVAPLAYMRGRTFKHTFIIGDEMQNTTPNQMKMLLTRIGEGSKMVITGDLEQNDINSYNGLQNIIDLFDKKYKENSWTTKDNNKLVISHDMIKDGFAYIDLDNSCIERHPVVQKIVELYKN